jgi:hypothetical protein
MTAPSRHTTFRALPLFTRRAAAALIAGGLLPAVAAGQSGRPPSAPAAKPPAASLPATDLVPGPAWAAQPAAEGQVRRAYDGAAQRTEVWVRLAPLAEKGHPNPTMLYVSAVYPGRTLRVTPDRVWIRAQSDMAVEPLRMRPASLTLVAGGTTLLAVRDPGLKDPAWVNYPCPPENTKKKPGCSFDGIVAALPILDFFRLLEAEHVFGEALGFPFRLSPDHRRALTDLAANLVPATAR